MALEAMFTQQSVFWILSFFFPIGPLCWAPSIFSLACCQDDSCPGFLKYRTLFFWPQTFFLTSYTWLGWSCEPETQYGSPRWRARTLELKLESGAELNLNIDTPMGNLGGFHPLSQMPAAHSAFELFLWSSACDLLSFLLSRKASFFFLTNSHMWSSFIFRTLTANPLSLKRCLFVFTSQICLRLYLFYLLQDCFLLAHFLSWTFSFSFPCCF